MLIAQITDTHLGFERDQPGDANGRRLEEVLAALKAMERRPDLLLLTGDLVEHGDDRQSYQRLKALLADLPFPVCPALGNHDDRAAFRAVFPEVPTAGGFVQYAVEGHELRLLVLDTLEEGRHGGGFCAEREAWLAERLDEQPGRPTLLALHHPPIDSGLSWMGEDPEAGWVRRLAGVVAGRGNVVGLVCGHLHRPVTTMFAGVPLLVCPSTAPQVALDLGTIDPERPDQRPMIVAEEPGFSLHLWSRDRLTSHGGTPRPRVIARFTPPLQPLVRMLLDERHAGD